MAYKIKSLNELKNILQKDLNIIMEEIINKSFLDLNENLEEFYNSPEGRYKRTWHLRKSPKMEIYIDGNEIRGKLYIDTSYIYEPSGRDTNTIYQYAESGGLLGSERFWRKTTDQIGENINKAFYKTLK